MMNSFQQRSSIPSSILTGIIGWIGFIIIGPLIFGITIPVNKLLLLGVTNALIQVAIMRLLFFQLRMHKHIWVGAFWGLFIAIGLYFINCFYIPELKNETLYWLIIYAYIGPPVGAFLSYFYIDDKKIFDANGGQKPDTSFGRDAHWLEPFGYGVIAYLIAFFSFGSFEMIVNVFIVGAMSGVFAAGASHFSPDRWKRNWILIFIIVVGVGSMQGFLTGLLFRNHDSLLKLSPIQHGMIGGVLTYLFTFLRGRQLAKKEEQGEL